MRQRIVGDGDRQAGVVADLGVEGVELQQVRDDEHAEVNQAMGR